MRDGNIPGKINNQRCWRLLAFLALIAALVLAPAFGGGSFVLAQSTEQSLQAARDQQKELARQLEAIRKEKNALTSSLGDLEGQLAWLNERSEEQQQLYMEKTDQLEAAIAELEKAYDDYLQAEDDVAAKQEQYVERLKTMFDYRQRSLFQVFLESRSIQGFFTTVQFMSMVADADQQMIEDLETARDHAEHMRQLAEEYSRDMAEVVARLEADLEKLRADAAATQNDMNQLAIQLSQQEQAEDDLVDESAKVGAEIVALQQQLEAEKAAQATAAAEATRAAQATKAAEAARRAQQEGQSGNSPNSKGWVWPYPGDRTVYSPYGMRTHPITRLYRMHTGVDLGGTYGNPIVAAYHGTVILVHNPFEGQNTTRTRVGYGNYIVIDHGDGIATLYAHLRDTYVSVGQSVTAGDRIASCGSTGASTGPHLHFEVLINGQHTDPLPYIR